MHSKVIYLKIDNFYCLYKNVPNLPIFMQGKVIYLGIDLYALCNFSQSSPKVH